MNNSRSVFDNYEVVPEEEPEDEPVTEEVEDDLTKARKALVASLQDEEGFPATANALIANIERENRRGRDTSLPGT